jgi:hypothetical protein
MILVPLTNAVWGTVAAFVNGGLRS